ncbi:hypothetical protein OLX02_18440 [Novosphingobium sp. KCTC 2891]|uniref:hypothetical protein n=1 Tax=unclassified Novosphingobium TaxID=2644732 RepID=UPI002222DCA4|nr:hypothetical protein [Novosphingobium sp. KCTC 2891]MCW1384799.1 hypothetical protein [Novosphingobium sp. KCTC 2891]
MKPGSRLKSSTCDSEVVVIRYAAGTLQCGGAPLGEGSGATVEIDPAFAGGTVMGKRYTDAAGTVELLCVKPGKGTLALDGVALLLKEAKPLPASD